MINTSHFGGDPATKIKHLGKIHITGEALILLLTKGVHIYEIVGTNLPYDTEFITFILNPTQNIVTLLVSHPSFPEVKEGENVWDLTTPLIYFGDGVLLKHLKENWFKFTMAQAIEEETTSDSNSSPV